ncbi:MAG: hypothetical protein KAR06_11910 [Deltaproteobacteria bacterium]|nr:hypothetical protein [Deltaproteobacteria bacterium]
MRYLNSPSAREALNPITASILAVELFGPGIGSYAAVACIISFLITGHRSIFPSQLVAQKKSASISFELGKEVDKSNPRFDKRKNSLLGVVFRYKAVSDDQWPGAMNVDLTKSSGGKNIGSGTIIIEARTAEAVDEENEGGKGTATSSVSKIDKNETDT